MPTTMNGLKTAGPVAAWVATPRQASARTDMPIRSAVPSEYASRKTASSGGLGNGLLFPSEARARKPAPASAAGTGYLLRGTMQAIRPTAQQVSNIPFVLPSWPTAAM